MYAGNFQLCGDNLFELTFSVEASWNFGGGKKRMRQKLVDGSSTAKSDRDTSN